jgi:4-hydroxy-2-oxoheptanedioate aldolase
MLHNPAKEKLLAGKPAFGYALALGSPYAAEALAGTGIDFIMIDGQHGSFGADATIATLMAITAGGSVPMARVARNDYTLIGRLLDDGALGIVVPMVDTAGDAKHAADACRFPPTGNRSWGWGRAARYAADYADRINDNVFVAVQIESITAVENAEAIMATPGVDGCWMGPSDLALSMGIHPRDMLNDDRHARAIERVLDACKNTGKIPGFAGGGPADALARAEQGFRFLTAGSDIGFMLDGATSGVKDLGLSSS